MDESTINKNIKLRASTSGLTSIGMLTLLVKRKNSEQVSC
jgi:hypothetical protein